MNARGGEKRTRVGASLLHRVVVVGSPPPHPSGTNHLDHQHRAFMKNVAQRIRGESTFLQREKLVRERIAPYLFACFEPTSAAEKKIHLEIADLVLEAITRTYQLPTGDEQRLEDEEMDDGWRGDLVLTAFRLAREVKGEKAMTRYYMYRLMKETMTVHSAVSTTT